MATFRSHRISTTNLLHLELTFVTSRAPFLFLTKAPHGPGDPCRWGWYPEGPLGMQMSLCPGWLGLLLRRQQGAVGNDMKKSKTNLMGFLRIATGPTYVSYNFIQGSSGPVGAKGSVGSPGPSGKKVSGISLRCQIWRKKYLPSFLDFHVNSSHDPGTINHPPAFCWYILFLPLSKEFLTAYLVPETAPFH